MVIRTDYVTNSSSSSFVIARDKELTEEQKKALLDFATKEFLGEIVLTPESSQEEIDMFFDDYVYFSLFKDKILKALEEGKDVYMGTVYFEPDSVQDVFYKAWNELEKAGGIDFIDNKRIRK